MDFDKHVQNKSYSVGGQNRHFIFDTFVHEIY